MTQQPRPAPEHTGAGLGDLERAETGTSYALEDGRDLVGPQAEPEERVTVAAAIDAFLFHCRYEKNLSPKTLKAYGTDLKQFTAHTTDRALTRIAQVDRGVLRGFIRELFVTLAEKSVKRKVATLKALFHYLEREDVVVHNPFRKMDVRIREARRVPRTIAWKDIQTLSIPPPR